MSIWDRYRELQQRFAAIEAEMATPEVAQDIARLQRLAKDRSHLQPLVDLFRQYEKAHDDLAQARDVAESGGESDLRDLASAEVAALEPRLTDLEERAKILLLPRDPNDARNVIVEIRAGAGGNEAGLWARDLFRSYTRYAERRKWRTDIVSLSENPAGGIKEIIFEVSGEGAHSRFKYESGVHRVQRVPQTEAQGRIHTSTATVAVLPEVEEVDLRIDEADIRTDRFHSGGAGGQNVNKVETGIRLTHLPTGIVVTCTDERSQLKNRLKAMAVLRARLYDLEQRRQKDERSESRRAQVGTGERAEKIRTYNYPENRVTDHRIGLTLHNLVALLEGDLDPLIDAVATDEQARLLEQESVLT